MGQYIVHYILHHIVHSMVHATVHHTVHSMVHSMVHCWCTTAPPRPLQTSGVLLLDEPTNHLDLDAVDGLAAAIKVCSVHVCRHVY